MSTVDKNGKTEQEFLREYDITRYFRPSVTVDAVLYRRVKADRLKILFVTRGGHPYLGDYAFPGGFVGSAEPCETAVLRELAEETHITDIALTQLVTASTPGRDPRWRNITVVYCGEVDSDIPALAGDDAAQAVWLDVEFGADGSMRFFGSDEATPRALFDCKLSPVFDAFGDLDLNSTVITERGKLAFDHAKIAYYLYHRLRRAGV